MDQAIPQHLVDAFDKLVAKGDEQNVRKFLLDHLKEFPEDSRDAIITAFVEEAIAKDANGTALIAKLQKDGLAAAASLTAAKKEVERQEKLINIKKGL